VDERKEGGLPVEDQDWDLFEGPRAHEQLAQKRSRMQGGGREEVIGAKYERESGGASVAGIRSGAGHSPVGIRARLAACPLLAPHAVGLGSARRLCVLSEPRKVVIS